MPQHWSWQEQNLMIHDFVPKSILSFSVSVQRVTWSMTRIYLYFTSHLEIHLNDFFLMLHFSPKIVILSVITRFKSDFEWDLWPEHLELLSSTTRCQCWLWRRKPRNAQPLNPEYRCIPDHTIASKWQIKE